MPKAGYLGLHDVDSFSRIKPATGLRRRLTLCEHSIAKNSSTTRNTTVQFQTNCWNTADFEFTGEF
jgi:hypothetical protein